MRDKLNVVLTWVERIAGATSVAVPAIRTIVSILDGTIEPGVALISDDQ